MLIATFKETDAIMTGHVRRRGKSSWELKFDVGTDPITGKRLTRYHSFKGTKREAQLELTRLISAASDGSNVNPSKLTVSEYLDRWERDWVAINVGAKTGERYGELMRHHVKPRLGALPLQKLRPANLGKLYATLLREGRGGGRGLAARTVGHVHRVLHKALAIAVDWELLSANVADRARPPRIVANEIEILTVNQVNDALNRLRDRPIYPIVALALATGLRRGELLALGWGHIDLDAGKLRVERSLEQTKAGGLRFKSPKTRHGRRAISLPPWIVRDLRRHRKAQQETRFRLGLGQLPDDALLFPNWDSRPRSPNAMTKEWERTAALLGLKISFHAFRHTHASQLIAAGMDVLTISRRLGHASPSITLNVYGHLFSNTDDEAARIMERAFGASSVAGNGHDDVPTLSVE
jgi:integrase